MSRCWIIVGHPRAWTHWRFCDQSTSLFISQSLPRMRSRRWEQSHFLSNYLELMRVMSKEVALSVSFCASIHFTNEDWDPQVLGTEWGRHWPQNPRCVQNYTLPRGLIQCRQSFGCLSRTDFSDGNLHNSYQCYFTTRLLSCHFQYSFLQRFYFKHTCLIFGQPVHTHIKHTFKTGTVTPSHSGTQSFRFGITFA